MTILLTGGAGFIGSHLAQRLLDDGHSVVCLDSLDDYYDVEQKLDNMHPVRFRPGFSFFRRDIRNRNAVEALFSEHDFDAVVHLAARAGVRPSVQNPALYVDVNVQGTLVLLEAMQRFGVRKMVMASSSSVYGDTPRVPFRETETCDAPLSPYAASKRAAELLAYTYHNLYNLDIFCLRFFTVYGPRQRPEMAISRFTENILQGEPIDVFGDGSTSRDYTYIDDIVDGIALALERVKGYEVLNVGSADPISLADLIAAIEKAVGKSALINRLPMQPGDVRQTYASVEKARRLIGYEPRVRIEEGIRRFVEWYRVARRQEA